MRFPLISAILLINGFKAVINKYKWTSDNKALADLLNTMLDQFGPPTSDRNPDKTEALKAAALLGGTVTDVKEFESVPGRIY